LCYKEKKIINGNDFYPNSGKEIEAWVIKPLSVVHKHMPCLVYFHGGAVISGTAEMYND
jgi:acetyl esterase/lipase